MSDIYIKIKCNGTYVLRIFLKREAYPQAYLNILLN